MKTTGVKNLAAALAFAAMSAVGVVQAQVTVVDSGTCGASGNNLTWELTSDSVLTIYGSGDMEFYRPFSPYLSPWDSLKSSFNTLKIGYGVTRIGEYAFYQCSNLTGHLVIPYSVTHIDYAAFEGCSGLKDLTIGMGDASYIPAQVFWGCTALTSITFLATSHPLVYLSAFANVPRTVPIYVPCGSIGDYQSVLGGVSGFTNFSAKCLPIHKVSVLSNDNSLGSVVGGGDYFTNNPAVLYAAPKASRTAFTSYAFTDWADGDTTNPRTITVISDTTLTANFAVIITDSMLMQQIDTLKSDTAALHNQVTNLQNDTILLNSIILALRSDIALLHSIIFGLQNDTALLHSIILALQNDTARLNGIILALQNDTALLHSIILGLQNDTALCNQYVLDLLAQIADLEADTALLNGIILGLEDEIAALSAQIADLEADTALLHLQIAALQTALDDCEEEKRILQALLDSCLNSLGTKSLQLPSPHLRIYPNPTTGKLSVVSYQLSEMTGDIEIFDVVGQIVGAYHIRPTNDEIVIDISHLANGMYFLKIDGKVFKVVKE